MAKLSKPLFSLNAIGALGKHLVFRKQGKGTAVLQRPLPHDARTPSQLLWRTMYQKAVSLWHLLSPEEKEAWERESTPRHMIGFAYFISQALKPNPGIYLPLAGGTMSGDIDMATNKILNLPAPTADEEPTRKADLATHAALPLAHVGVIPVFHVHKNNNNQTIFTSTWTKITWVTEVYDTHGDFASNKFTPTIPGKYLFIGGFRINSLDTDKRMLTSLYKNGSNISYLGQPHASHTMDVQIVGSFISSANGSTDYFELFVYQNSGASRNLSGHIHSTFFQGFRIVA